MTKPPFVSRSRLVAALLALSPLSGAACSSSDAPSPSPSATTAAGTTATPTALASATASATGSAVTPAPAPAKPSSFVSVAPLTGVTRLFPVKGALVVAREELDAKEPGTQLGFLKGDKLDFSGKFSLFSDIKRLVTIQGAWPDQLWVLSNTSHSASREKLGPLGINTSAATQESQFVGAAQVGLALVALRTSTDADRAGGIDTLYSQGPWLEYEIARNTAAECDTQKAVVASMSFCSTTTGALLSVGKKCNGSLAVERWAAPGKPSDITDVPATDKLVRPRLVAGAKGDAWLFADDLFYFDGTAWKKQPPPPAALYLSDGRVADDGTLWALARGVQGRLVALQSGAYREEPLPGGDEPTSLAIAKDGTVWVTSKTALYRTRRPSDPPAPSP